MRSPLAWYRDLRHRAELRSLPLLGAGAVPSAPVLSGTYITPQTALGLTAVYAAINVISRDIASLPLNVYRKLPGGGFEVDENHPVQPLLAVEPNDEVDAHRFRQTALGHTLGWGNGYAEIERRSGFPVALHLLHPAHTIPKRTKGSQRLYYELENDQKLLPEDTLHFAGLGFDGIKGYCPVTICRQSLGVGVAAEQYGAGFFGNSAIPRGLLKVTKRLSEAALNNLRRSFNQVHQGSQSVAQVGILEEGMDWVATPPISPEDAQFLGTRQFTVVEIARLFGVPPHKIGDYSQAHLANVEESNLDYLNTTIVGWVCMLEAQLNLKLLTAADRRTHVIRHDLTALQRGNMTARIAYYTGLRNMGAINTDEIRARESLNPIGPAKGGDLYLVQSQYTRLDQAGQQPEPAPAPPKEEQAGRAIARRHNPNHDPNSGRFASHGGGLKGISAGGGHDEDLQPLADKAAQVAKDTGHRVTFESGPPLNRADAKALANAQKHGVEVLRVSEIPSLEHQRRDDHSTYHVDTILAAHVGKDANGRGYTVGTFDGSDYGHGLPQAYYHYKTREQAEANALTHSKNMQRDRSSHVYEYFARGAAPDFHEHLGRHKDVQKHFYVIRPPKGASS